MFAIGDRKWPGISKYVEEIGELQEVLGRVQKVLGKLMGSRGETSHWSGDLLEMLHDETADVLAAIHFVIDKCGLNRERIERRAGMKLAKFMRWHEEDREK